METVKTPVEARGGGLGRDSGAQRIWGSETALCDTIVTDTCHHPRGQGGPRGGPWALGDGDVPQ